MRQKWFRFSTEIVREFRGVVMWLLRCFERLQGCYFDALHLLDNITNTVARRSKCIAAWEITILFKRINYSNGFRRSWGNSYGRSRGLADNGSNGIPLNILISYSSDMEKANQCQTWHSSTFAMYHFLFLFGKTNNILYLQVTNTASLKLTAGADKILH